MMGKLTVITDARGAVVATQVGHGFAKDAQSGLVGGIVAGPGQNLHKIDFDVPLLKTPADVEAFHHKVLEHLPKRA